LVGLNCVKNVENYGAEVEAAWGPFSVQAEYLGMHYNRDPGIIFWQNQIRGGTHPPGDASINFDGFYVYATWYLTGESRAEQYRGYEEFNAPGNGNVAQIKILNPWSAGGWGAWELAARVSEINLNDGGFSFFQPLGTVANIQGGRQTDFTLGLNWYPDKGIRFMANWVDVFQYSAPFNRPDLNGIHPQVFELRAQVDW
jgi:phosphate-selective porin OprO and OprP